MLLANLGAIATFLAWLACIYASIMSVLAVRKSRADWLESARLAAFLSWPLLTLACLLLIILITQGHFEVAYVSRVSSWNMPWYLKVTALWGGQQGSLLFWSWLMSTFIGIALMRDWKQERDLYPYVISVLSITLAFFLLLNNVLENPFVTYWQDAFGTVSTALFPPSGTTLLIPEDGNGLNPLLRHPGMIIHPPMLYLGFIGFIIPYAFAMAALIVGRTDDAWMRVTRRWSLFAWLFLSLGLILGGRWAYDVLGWGGYWGWDPVENAALLPWLSGTAFLHSVVIQEKRGMFKHWNLALVIITYSLVVLGTFLTRSGTLSSVHAFAASSLGPVFLTYITIMAIVAMGFLFYRWNSLKPERPLESWLSKEGLFLLNNLLFMVLVVTILWGVLYPIFSELFTGQVITVGPPFYEATTGPIWLALVILMGVAPLSAWNVGSAKRLGKMLWLPAGVGLLLGVGLASLYHLRWESGAGLSAAFFTAFVTLSEYFRGAAARRRTKNEGWLNALWNMAIRNRRRYGGYFIHLGVVLMAVGIIGVELFQTTTQGSIPLHGSLKLAGYEMHYEKLNQFVAPDGRSVTRAVVSVWKNGQPLGELYPRQDFYPDSQQTSTIPGVRSTLQDDFYVLLAGWEPIAAEGATFKIYHNPLVNWLWLGSIIFIAGISFAAWREEG
jgi:cytochrome c-type biogenesis protein CcmF